MSRLHLGLLVAALATTLGTACATPNQGQPATQTQSQSSVQNGAAPPLAGLDLSVLDRTVSPCSDFYQFACGNWLAKTQIPEDRPLWNRSFSEIHQRNEAALHELLEDFAQGKISPNSVPYAQQLGDYEASCMDERTVEELGLTPLEAELSRIHNVHDATSLEQELAHLHGMGIRPLFGLDVTQDYADATQVIAEVRQGGLGLPDRDFYFNTDEHSQKMRQLYVPHIQKMLELAGESTADAAADAAAVMKLETELAKVSLTRTERRDPKNVYHRLDLDGLTHQAPAFPWAAYFADLGHADITQINVTAPAFFTRVNELVTQTPAAEWQAYLRWHLLHSTAPLLPARFVDEDFNFTRSALTGTKKLLERWKRCVVAADRSMGFALGRAFVQKNFSPESKQRSLEMVQSIEAAFGDNLQQLAWMDDSTKAKAREKLAALGNKIGYPERWRSYEGLKIARGTFLQNSLAAAAFDLQYDLAKVGKPLDRTEWEMTPPTVNAYYSASMNEMVFPAGILESPFYSATSSVPVNYGGIGMVMGHELSHGFDDQGRKFDGKGNLANWWSDAAAAQFATRAQCVANQFDEFTVVNGTHLNGKQALGENIADLAGLKLAFHAMKAKNKSPSAPADATKDEFTPEQAFFINFAQSWCQLTRDDYALNQVKADVHSPPQFRVNGPLSNLTEFQQAFSCGPGSPMVRPPEKRCEIW